MTELKPAQRTHSVGECDYCLYYAKYRVDRKSGCAVCGKDFQLIHYGHITCPECGAELIHEDPDVDELGREEKRWRLINRYVPLDINTIPEDKNRGSI